jgi:hypothetical protein
MAQVFADAYADLGLASFVDPKGDCSEVFTRCSCSARITMSPSGSSSSELHGWHVQQCNWRAELFQASPADVDAGAMPKSSCRCVFFSP